MDYNGKNEDMLTLFFVLLGLVFLGLAIYTVVTYIQNYGMSVSN